MTTVNLQRAHLSVTAELPDGLVRPLRNLKRQIKSRRGPASGPVPNLLVVSEAPTLHLHARDPQGQIPFLRSMTQGRAVENEPVRPGDTNGQAPNDGLRRAVEQVSWYHTVALPGGVVTPGFYDHRPLVPHYGLPERIEGRRVLDVATADGFWAFELERRGADVTATDVSRISELDLPLQLREVLSQEALDARTGAGFAIAHDALGSKVRRLEKNVYDLNPRDMGTFDLVHVADLLLHLENPLRALRAIRSVTDGSAHITDCFDPHLSGNGLTRYGGGWNSMCWWTPSLDTLGQMILDAGFASVDLHAVYTLRSPGMPDGPRRATFVARTGA
jgi:tRNA (mo5U34)-methyltransferase